jgi:antitoxin component YwqK of YwqJK toxin-antitoxin module
MSDLRELTVAEIPYNSGAIHFRYERYLSPGGRRWVRHGSYREYYENGSLASEGRFEDGREQGEWRDYHENGQLAALGAFVDGREDGVWQFWNDKGKDEETIVYRDGIEIKP